MACTPLRSALSRWPLGLVLLGLSACTTPFDMSSERAMLPTPDLGIVIGSVLVLPETDEYGGFTWAREAAGRAYKFQIVQIKPDDPYGTGLTARKYDFTAKAGEEKVFVSRLLPGDYLVKAFRDTGLAGLGGELDVVLSVEAGAVRYVGRLQLHVPHYLSRGKGYRFTIDNTRGETLARVGQQQPALTETVVDAPMQVRKVVTP